MENLFMTVLDDAKEKSENGIDVSGHILQLIGDIHLEQGKIYDIMCKRTAQIDDIGRKLDAHAEESSRRHLQILGAFPSSDTEGHRRYHESVIEWRERRNKLVSEALTKVAAAGFWAGIVWVAVAIWKAVLITIKQG